MLGIILYELFSNGEKPFSNVKSLADYLKKIENRDIDWNELIPHKMQQVIKKCLNLDPFQRPHIIEIADFIGAL